MSYESKPRAYPLRMANANVSDVLNPDMFNLVADLLGQVLTAMQISNKDPNTAKTAERWAKSLINELCGGKYKPKPDITAFPNSKKVDELYTIGPIRIASLCSHHMLPFIGKVWIGLLPNKDGILLGASKFVRLTEWIFHRPQIQEDATAMLADEIEHHCKPDGLAVIVKAGHLCMQIRGVNDPEVKMTTSVMRGRLRESTLKQEFLSFINGGD